MFGNFFVDFSIQKIFFLIQLLLVGLIMFRLIDDYTEISRVRSSLRRFEEEKEPLLNRVVHTVPILRRLKVKLENDLYRCGMDKSPYTVIGNSFAAAFLGFILGLSINNIPGALLMMCVGFYIPMQIISDKIYKKTRNIDRQIMNLIQLFLNEYQKTTNVTEVLTRIIPELDAPLDREVGLVIRELNSGYELRDVLHRFAESLDNEWIYLFVNAIVMNKENGTEITNTLMDTLLKIANKEIVEGDRDSEIYSGKVLAYIMVAFVPIAFIASCLMQEGAASLYLNTSSGRLVIDVAIISAIGGYAISKLVERI